VAKITIFTDNAPSAIGPYSQAICVEGSLTFTSGQIPLDPNTGNLVSEDFEEQAIQTLKNIEYILKERSRTLNDIIKLTVFLTDLSNFDSLNKTFSLFFKDDYPARSVVEVSRLPKNSKIEIEAIFNDEL
tara:strand:- start:457 stop:846 length:390 start_codon:yes stop_codon:yes gene_type:complete